MSSNIESINSKFTIKMQILQELSEYLIIVLAKYKKNNDKEINDIWLVLSKELENIQIEIEKLQNKYLSHTALIITEYHQAVTKNDSNTAKQLFDNYSDKVVAENFINILDAFAVDLKKIYENFNLLTKFNLFITTKIFNNKEIIEKLEIAYENHDINQLNFDTSVNKFLEYYYTYKISFPNKNVVYDDCECGNKMMVDTVSSHKTCEFCGYQVYLPGTVFDDTQHYNQQGQLNTKHKRYDSNRHCERWIKQIQALEDIGGLAFQKVVDILDKKAVREYTRDGKLRSMKNLKCKQIREWLKEFKLTTKWNDHAPLLRKTITVMHGEAVSPPQLTKEEEDEILMDFSMDMNLYEELSKKPEILQLIDKDAVKNKPYYPFGLLKVLCQRLKGDARLVGLIECIHFQSPSTNVKNDKIYKLICQFRGKKYEPTDRTILVEIS
jgi:hypothetical protein